MSRWRFTMDATVTVSVEADTPDEAVKAARKTLVEVGVGHSAAETISCSIVRIIASEDGVEVCRIHREKKHP